MAQQVHGRTSWKEKLTFALSTGLLDQRVKEKETLAVLINGKGPQDIENDSFLRKVIDYVHVNKVLGLFQKEKGKDTDVSGKDRAASGSLVVIRGNPKAALLHHLGDEYGLNPEGILENYGFSESFRIRSLPSRTPSIASVRFITLGTFAVPYSLDGMESGIRIELEQQLADHYTESLDPDRSGFERVRNINVHGDRMFTVEQQATFLTYKDPLTVGKAWSGVLLTDYGRRIIPPPWLPASLAGVKAQFYPLAVAGHCSISAIDVVTPRDESENRDWERPDPFQNRVHVDDALMTGQDRGLVCTEPMLFFLDLVNTSALTWAHALSFLRESLNSLPANPTAQAPRLRADKALLDRAISYFTDTISFLQHPPREWHRGNRSDELSKSAQTDLKALQDEAESLSKWCSESISIAMSTISITDAQKSLDETRRVQYITYLAFIFIPMSYIASCFGMNIQELQDPGSTLRLYFIIAVPFTVVAVAVPAWIEWNSGVKHFCKKFWNRRLRGKTSDKSTV